MKSKTKISAARRFANVLLSAMILTAVCTTAHAQDDTNHLFDGGNGSLQNAPMPPTPPPPPTPAPQPAPEPAPAPQPAPQPAPEPAPAPAPGT